ncbi:MAG TPA: argininosuccinate synthase [Thermodesulfobacteriota bacterium]|nr:argininosuccinate synthase [Deltaproteobacteria bacterium]HNR14854.1 argininosuccinate synthase [Thermodesulfobacteriota bacterium]HOC38269.1 argininosuccinate synthase [Thermodesulfobacteriota bacterium]HQO77998.1 argininosuccinate synthase [Thermodesulfobacteriota bacterium]
MDVNAILEKVNATPVPKVKKVALAYSGGLDSALAVVLLRNKYQVEEILPITIDIGQGEEEMHESKSKAEVLGVTPLFVDLRDEFTEVWISRAIHANSDYRGYPVSTSMTRQIIARKVAEIAVEKGCDALMEGSSGKGNDQYRMHNVFKTFAPKLAILVPVRDFDLTRGEEEVLCRHWGVPVTETITGGDDKTMWCRSIASGAVDLNQEIPDNIWMWYTPPEKAPDKPEMIEIEFKEGVPIALNQKQMKLADLVPALNTIGGRNGIGKIDMFEDGIMDLKSREIYEAPAATIILKLHRDLEQFCLTKDELQFKKMVEMQWSYLVYHGMAYHPLRADLDAFLKTSQGVVNGTYKVKLYKGNIDIVGRESKTGLFYPEIRSIKGASFNQKMCADAAHVRGLPFEILGKRGIIPE